MHRSYSMQDGGKVWGMGVPVHDGRDVYAAINILMLRSACSGSTAARNASSQLGVSHSRSISSMTQIQLTTPSRVAGLTGPLPTGVPR
jgi:hypothetical protein